MADSEDHQSVIRMAKKRVVLWGKLLIAWAYIYSRSKKGTGQCMLRSKEQDLDRHHGEELWRTELYTI